MISHLEVTYNLLDNMIQNPVDILPFSAEEKFIQLNFTKLLAVKLLNFDLGAKARQVEVNLYHELNNTDSDCGPSDDADDKSILAFYQRYMDEAGKVQMTDEVRDETVSRLDNFLANKDLYPDLLDRIANYKYGL